jgi:hypothetical protein
VAVAIGRIDKPDRRASTTAQIRYRWAFSSRAVAQQGGQSLFAADPLAELAVASHTSRLHTGPAAV